MEILAINGRPRENRNAERMRRLALAEIEAAGIETETVCIAGRIKRGCSACMKCREPKSGRRVFGRVDPTSVPQDKSAGFKCSRLF